MSLFSCESINVVLFAQIWSLDGGKGWKRTLHRKKVTIYMIFVIFQICVAIVDCFVCLRICVHLRCGLLFNAHVTFAIDQNNIFVNKTSIEVYVLTFENKNKKKIDRLTKKST